MNLADNLKRIRKDNNLSQEQLAEKLGVSRQSVSKWESNQAYPEMDKVLQICQMFNLNIDDLLNQDLKEVNNSKQSKNNINKFIDDFLDFITKTIDMFSSMKFKEKIKCLFEQILIGGILTLILIIIGAIGSSIVQNVFMILPDQIYFLIYNITESIYFCISFILILVLLIHIFKVRYLDYYIIVKYDETPNVENDSQEKINYDKHELENKKIVLEKKKEKVIIRDPKHSGYKFITFLLKGIILFLKIFASLIGITFCFTLVCFFVLLVISFSFVKTGLLFLGVLLILISGIVINLIVLLIIYHFIISQKNKKSKLASIFIISLIFMGIGIGFISTGITSFDYIADIDSNYFIKEEIIMEMDEGLFIENYYGQVEFIESNDENLRLVYKHSPNFELEMVNIDNNGVYFYSEVKENNIMNLIRCYIKDINNKIIVDYSKYKIYIYTTKENIEILENNRNNYYLNQQLQENVYCE